MMTATHRDATRAVSVVLVDVHAIKVHAISAPASVIHALTQRMVTDASLIHTPLRCMHAQLCPTEPNALRVLFESSLIMLPMLESGAPSETRSGPRSMYSCCYQLLSRNRARVHPHTVLYLRVGCD